MFQYLKKKKSNLYERCGIGWIKRKIEFQIFPILFFASDFLCDEILTSCAMVLVRYWLVFLNQVEFFQLCICGLVKNSYAWGFVVWGFCRLGFLSSRTFFVWGFCHRGFCRWGFCHVFGQSSSWTCNYSPEYDRSRNSDESSLLSDWGYMFTSCSHWPATI